MLNISDEQKGYLMAYAVIGIAALLALAAAVGAGYVVFKIVTMFMDGMAHGIAELIRRGFQ